MTEQAEERSELLGAMQEAADILLGKVAPSRLHHRPAQPRTMDVKASGPSSG